jgi:hypothetical protein
MSQHEYIRVGVRLIGVMLIALGIVGSIELARSILNVFLEDARWTNPVTEEDLAAIEALLSAEAVAPIQGQGLPENDTPSDPIANVPLANTLEVYRDIRLDIAPLLLLVVGWYFIFRGRWLVRAIHASVHGPPTPVAPPST